MRFSRRIRRCVNMFSKAGANRARRNAVHHLRLGLLTIDGRTADLEKPYEAIRAEACCRRQTRLGPLGLPILTTPLTKRHDLRYMLVGRRCKLRARPQREPYLPLVDQASQPQPLQYPRLLPGGQRHHVGVPLDASAAVHVDVTRL